MLKVQRPETIPLIGPPRRLCARLSIPNNILRPHMAVPA